MSHNDLSKVQAVLLETTSWCNRKCSFCPNSTIEKHPQMLMTLETLGMAISELRRIKYRGRIHLYGNGEPLTDRRLPEIIRTVRQAFPENHLFISTNGDLASGEMALDRLMDAGLDEIHVSHYDDRNKHLKERAIPGVHHFDLGTLGLEFYNRGGHVRVGSLMDHKRCWWAYGKMYMNYRGDICLCCSDWKGEVVWGNINERSLTEIWQNDRYRHYRETHATGRGKQYLPFCNKCNR